MVISLKESGVGWPKRAASAAEEAEEDVEVTRGAELASAAVSQVLASAAVFEVVGGAGLVATAVVTDDAGVVATASSPRRLLAPSARAFCSASRARAVSCVASSVARSGTQRRLVP